ncbi:carboxypeptidase regulatory-like domain-containing protein [Fictibacillus sp. 5RED26]|uniref:carboxypeptidase regulatory-like domain-containing protein n=1 Tax=Fictibacillus sp. 5RED26 TaxID=2745876 RepID=UPI0018CF1397|nr:carboxypeptidase regulatory-like domain-containing protein [Fictibacillus sp. 5RED26]MBH0156312.1 carboxypeptidase regulatory-like domain-containing protein [Fictibacillus sp. 5RED26]
MSFPTNSQFTAITVGGVPYADVIRDISPAGTDIVGNASFPSFYFAYDEINVYFRMRVRSDPRNSAKTAFANFAWGVLLNTTGVAGTYDWLLAVNGLNKRVNLVQNTTKQVNSWSDPAEGTDGKGNPNYSRSIINFDVARVVQADSTLDNTQNYFIDFLVPASTFFSLLGITAQSSVRMVAFTASNNNNYNKDSLRDSEEFQFQNAFSNPVTINSGNVRANLQVSKVLLSGPQSPLAGQVGEWTGRITLSNTGKSAANILNVTDIVSLDEVSLFSVLSVSQGTTAYNSSTKTLTWSVGNIAPGASATLQFTQNGIFYTAGTKALNTVRATGIDSFTGGDLTPASASISVNVQATGGAAGTLLDSSNAQPVNAATVRLLMGQTPVAVTQTDLFGKYSLTNIAPGTYTIEFSKANYTSLAQSVVIQSGTITVINPVLIAIPGILQGTVTSNTGSAVSGATVLLSDNLGTVIASVTTSPTGAYTFGAVIPGHYTLTVSANNFQAATIGQNVPSNQTTTANFVLQPNPGTVSGTITGSGGPIAGAIVEALSGTGIAVATATTDGAGQYTINRLAPGSYRLRVSAPAFQTFVVGFSVSAGQTVVVDVNLLANPGSIIGTVIDEDSGAPLPGASLKVVNSSGITDASVTTDVNGQFSVDSLAPGTYVITFSSDGHGTKTIGTYVQSDQTTTVDVTLRRLAGVLTGNVSSGGSTISGASVDVVLNNIVVAKTITDSNGNYTISGLAPDRYTVIVGADGFSPVTLGAVIQDNETTAISTELQPIFGLLSGSVLDNEGNILPGAVILVKNADSDVLISRAVTDTNGNYVIGELLPGSYVVTANIIDYQTNLSGAIITAGVTSVVNFSLMPNPSSISGTVINSETGDPLAGASVEVQLLNANGLIINTTFSDNDGVFIVEDLMPSTYTVIVAAESFQTSSASVTLSPGNVSSITISLVPSPGFVSGRLIDSLSGQPVVGATINISNTLGAFVDSALTSADGTFISLGLPGGVYSLTAVAEGYETRIIGVVVPAGLNKFVNFELQPNPGTITGTVAPAADGLVLQLYTMDNQFVNTVAATPEGNFLFQSLAPGNYIVKAVALNYSVGSTGAFVVSGQTTNISLSIQPNPGTVSGTLISDLGTPIANGTVSLLDVNETPIGNGTTDADGNYTLSNIPAGSYAVVIRAGGYANATGNVAVAPGQDITALNFELVTIRGSISGTVSDLISGAPIPGAAILVRDSLGILVRFSTTDQFGNFLLRNFVPGSYAVTSSAQNYSTEITGVIVQSDETAGADIQLTSTVGSISGQVTDGDGNPLSGDNIQLKLFGANGELLQALIAHTDGSFQIPELSIGTYFVSAEFDGYSPNMTAVIVNSSAVSSITIPLSQILTTLTGSIADSATGNPISGTAVSVTLTNNTGMFVAKQYPGIDGTFTFDSIAPGIYLLNVNAVNYGNEIITVTVPITGFNIAVSLTQNPGAVTGYVTNQLTGDPLSNAIIIVSSSGKPLERKGVSDSFGQFIFANLSPDTYRAIVSADGYSSQSATFTVLPDETTSLSFILTPEPGTVSGTITDAVTGIPISQVMVQVRYLSPTGPVIANTVTDQQGNYVTQGVYSGPYTIVAFTDDGYGSSSASVFVPPNDTRVVDFALEPFPATVEGTITSDSGDPLVNVSVRLLDVYGFTVRVVNTDSNGFYRILGFTEGQYLVTAIIPDYQRRQVSINAGPGETLTANISLVPEPGQISGVILDEQTLAPLVGAQVEVYAPSGVTPIARRTTGAAGDFLIEGVAPRSYTLNAFQLNYSIRSTGVIVTSNATTNVQIALVPDPASISGTITDGNGIPLSNASVRVVDENDSEIGNGITDFEGNYVIGNLPEGSYTVIAGVENYSSSTAGVSLQPGEQLTGLNVILTPVGGLIFGTVVSAETGEGLPGILISILTPEGIPIISTNSDTAGSFTSILLSPGTYTVIASSPYYVQDQLGVIVLPNQTSAVSFELSEVGGSIVGTVTDQSGNPISDRTISIRLLNDGGVLLQTLIALSDGSFAFQNLSAGTYQVNVIADGYQTATVGAIVVNGETTNLIVPVTEDRGALEGVIQDVVTGLPISGSFIEVSDVSGILVATITTDQNGFFRLGNLQTGPLNIRAIASGYGAASIGVIINSLSLSNVTLNLQPDPGIIIGTIKNPSGAPLSNTTVQILDRKNTPISTVITNGNGSYEVDNLVEGQYTVTAKGNGTGTGIGSGVVLPDQETVVDIILIPEGGVISGNVRNSTTGDPLIGASIEIRAISPFGPVINTVLTDSTGNYSSGLITAGTYTLTITKENFGTATGTVLIENGLTTFQNFALTPSLSNVRGTISARIIQNESLTTTISAQDVVIPLINTVIRLIDESGAELAEVQTDDQGMYLIENFLSGIYSLGTSNPDYETNTVGFSVDPGQTQIVDIELTALPGILTGTIIDQETGILNAGAIVQLFFGTSVQPAGRAVTNNAGVYVINGLSPGQYTVSMTTPNYNTFSAGATIQANATTTVDGFLLSNPGVLTGIVNGLSDVISGASIKVIDVNGTVIGSAVSNDDGTFFIGNLPVGTYALTIVALDFQSETEGITITPGETLNVSINLIPDPGAITGIVTDESGIILPGVVMNILLNNIIIASTVTEQNGSFTFRSLKPNSYQVTANLSGYAVSSVGAVVSSNIVTTTNLFLSSLYGSIFGTVTDEDGNLITQQSIKINLFDLNNSLITTVLAQSNGTYIIPEVTEGNYFVTVTTEGYNAATFAVTVNGGEEVSLDLQLIALGGTLTIRVIDAATNNPISGVKTNIFNETGIPITSGITDQNGVFIQQNLEEGAIVISTVKGGYGSLSQGGIIVNGATTEVSLALTLETGNLIGTISDSNGVSIAGAVVQILDATRAVVTTVLTQSDGAYRVLDLLPGIYTMIVSARGFEQRSLSVFIVANETTITNLPLAFEPGSVEGFVTNEGSGSFIARASVELRLISPSGPVVASTLTDEQGRYRFSQVRNGNYTIISTKQGFGNDSAEISVIPGDTTFADLQLAPVTSSVRGTVRNAGGSQPLVNTLLRLADNNGVVIAEVQTDNDGDYLIEGLLPGDFSLAAINADYRSSVLDFTAVPNVQSVVNFNLVAVPSLFTGFVTDADTGLPIVGAIVETFDQVSGPVEASLLNAEVNALAVNGRPVAVALTNIDGFYTIPGLNNGSYTLRASALGYGTDSRLSVLPVNTTVEQNFALPGQRQTASITGTVIILGNGPLPNAEINVFDENGALAGSARTGNDGTYFISNLGSGRYVITVDAQGFQQETLIISLAEGERLTGVDFALSPGADGDISGQVSERRTGRPVSGAVIQLFDLRGVLVREVISNDAGVFSITGIPSGSYELRVVANGFEPFSVAVNVREGEELLIPISLISTTPDPVPPFGEAQFLILIGGKPLSLDSLTSPTLFTLERIDSNNNCATFSYEAEVQEGTIRRFITFDLSCIDLIRFID